MNPEINRRDFLKLLALASAAMTTSSEFLISPEHQGQENSGNTPNILILVFDTLSAEHMSLYGYPRSTTPNMERFAERGTVYHNHYASGNFTTPGTASLLTGVYPWTHRGFNMFGTVADEFKDINLFRFMKQVYSTDTYTHNVLVEQLLIQFEEHITKLNQMKELRVNGNVYSEDIFPSDFSVAFWSENILRGTQSPDMFSGSLFLSRIQKELLERSLLNLPDELLAKYPLGLPHNDKGMFFNLEDSIDWIQDQLVKLPQGYLCYYHLWPPHSPYKPRAEFIGQFDDGWTPTEKPEHYFSKGDSTEELQIQRRIYDEYIGFVDAEFGRLYDYLNDHAILDNSYIIITSDHGELFERGIQGHVTPTLYQGLIHIPLIISKPGQQSRTDIYSPTSCVDLLPTLISLADLGIPDNLEGQILPGFESTQLSSDDRSIFAIEAKTNSKYSPLTHCTLALIRGRYKLVRYLGYEVELEDELFDIENDPEEIINLNNTKKTLLEDMQLELSEKLYEVNQPDHYRRQ